MHQSLLAPMVSTLSHHVTDIERRHTLQTVRQHVRHLCLSRTRSWCTMEADGSRRSPSSSVERSGTRGDAMPRWAQVLIGLLVLAVGTGVGCGVGFVAGAGLSGGGLSLSRNSVAIIKVLGTI